MNNSTNIGVTLLVANFFISLVLYNAVMFKLKIITFLFIYNLMSAQSNNQLIWLEKGDIKLGILNDVGGRIVSLQYQNGNNILKANADQWSEPVSERPKATAKGDWKAYNGHEIWLGPQSEWWMHQNANGKRKRKKEVWPPDPFIIYGNYKIEKLSKAEYIGISPESEVWGVQVTKEVKIEEPNKIIQNVIVKNIRTEPISWDIWMNTRLDGLDRCYVPISENGLMRVEGAENENRGIVKHQIIDRFFTFEPQIDSSKLHGSSTKAFIHPSVPLIAGFTKNNLFIIRFEQHKAAEIHPQQAMVEIFNNTIYANPNDNILELEYHAPYKTLQVGETMAAWEIWEVYPYAGNNTSEAQVAYLKNILKFR